MAEKDAKQEQLHEQAQKVFGHLDLHRDQEQEYEVFGPLDLSFNHPA